MTTPYAAQIAEVCPEYDPRHIEAFMRSEMGTLDHLDRYAFAKEAWIAAECVNADPALAERLAQSYGW